MKLRSRCPHCQQIETVTPGFDTQSAHACPSCGLRYVPQRHLFMAAALAQSGQSGSGGPGGGPAQAKASAAAAPTPTAPASRSSGWLWFGLSLLLGLLLTAQIGLHQRHLWAARWPWMRPVLQALCRPFDCRIQTPLMLSALSVESSGFDQQDNGDFIFSLHLRHDRDHPVATPAIELTLTDSQERAVVRKVLLPAHIGLPPVLAAGNGLESEARFELEPELHEHVSGFRIELFYP